ncbi:MAG: hypothetical protein HY789_01985 [Deltaproteobacteria bacterium]|nr:hypothetical protein [Deltaproteobacteria bacterium]
MKKNYVKRSLWALSLAVFILAAAGPRPVAAEEEEVANNLSFPLVFAEGYGLTGRPAYEQSGLPGGIFPVFATEYCFQDAEYYLQASDSLWQAQWSADRLLYPDEPQVSVTLDWSNEVVGMNWDEKSVIPVAVFLSTSLGEEKKMTGYEMKALPADILPCDLIEPLAAEAPALFVASEEEEVDEVWGTTGVTYESNKAGVYSVCARLKIQKIDQPGPEAAVLATLFNSAVYEGFGVHGRPLWYTAEIDSPGRVVYLYNWNLALMQQAADVSKAGWYRLSFSLDAVAEYTISLGKYIVSEKYSVDCEASLDRLDESDITGVQYLPILKSPSLSYVDIYIAPLAAGE